MPVIPFLPTIGWGITVAEVSKPGSVIGSANPFKAVDIPEPAPLSETPTIESAISTATEKTKSRKAAIARSRSVYTSPLGLSTEAEISKKTLLGQ